MKLPLGVLLAITCAIQVSAEGTSSSRPATEKSRHVSYSVGTSHLGSRVDGFKIDFDLPVVKGAPELGEVVARSMRRFREREITNLRRYCNELATASEKCEGDESVGFDVVFTDEHLLSIRLECSSDSKGAAHPSHGTETFTWTVRKPHLLVLRDLFRGRHQYLPRISELARAKLRADIELSELTDPEWIDRGTEPTEENFRAWAISDHGLSVVFVQYQVAAYVAGPQEIQLSWKELTDLVDPNGPIGYQLK